MNKTENDENVKLDINVDEVNRRVAILYSFASDSCEKFINGIRLGMDDKDMDELAIQESYLYLIDFVKKIKKIIFTYVLNNYNASVDGCRNLEGSVKEAQERFDHIAKRVDFSNKLNFGLAVAFTFVNPVSFPFYFGITGIRIVSNQVEKRNSKMKLDKEKSREGEFKVLNDGLYLLQDIFREDYHDSNAKIKEFTSLVRDNPEMIEDINSKLLQMVNPEVFGLQRIPREEYLPEVEKLGFSGLFGLDFYSDDDNKVFEKKKDE